MPKWLAPLLHPFMPLWLTDIGYRNYYLLIALLFGTVLVAGAPRRSGIAWGRTGRYFLRCVVVCAVPVALVAIIYPLLPVQPFRGGPIGTWLISPLAQDLVFIGFLYGRLEQAFPGPVHRRVPIDRALLITAGYFAAWHLPNFLAIEPGYVLFQLCYTSILFVWTGLTRQWTGSILFFTLTHSAINLIAWL